MDEQLNQQEEAKTPEVKKQRGNPNWRKKPFLPTSEQHEAAVTATEEIKDDEHTGRVMINLGRKITDQEGQMWHIRRRWVPLSPAVCQVKDCGYDFIELHGLTVWDDAAKANRRMLWEEMTPQEQEIAQRIMAEHASTHRHEAAQVVTIKDEEDMNWPPTKKTGSRLPKRLQTTF